MMLVAAPGLAGLRDALYRRACRVVLGHQPDQDPGHRADHDGPERAESGVGRAGTEDVHARGDHHATTKNRPAATKVAFRSAASIRPFSKIRIEAMPIREPRARP